MIEIIDAVFYLVQHEIRFLIKSLHVSLYGNLVIVPLLIIDIFRDD